MMNFVKLKVPQSTREVMPCSAQSPQKSSMALAIAFASKYSAPPITLSMEAISLQ